ncbi:hypothetical protein NDU88_001159 [Pleurodeles waltl]|uniref:Uncharacterized protein n=1 Tax=Pleurodeles waltl TaxID=8319 RepID=A0AAV7S6N9_PLEWA|nr:hypothetical protein NDU88_001159 [Pleurodeles waltl]
MGSLTRMNALQVSIAQMHLPFHPLDGIQKGRLPNNKRPEEVNDLLTDGSRGNWGSAWGEGEARLGVRAGTGRTLRGCLEGGAVARGGGCTCSCGGHGCCRHRKGAPFRGRVGVADVSTGPRCGAPLALRLTAELGVRCMALRGHVRCSSLVRRCHFSSA